MSGHLHGTGYEPYLSEEPTEYETQVDLRLVEESIQNDPRDLSDSDRVAASDHPGGKELTGSFIARTLYDPTATNHSRWSARSHVA
jgi:hypothetical protein